MEINKDHGNRIELWYINPNLIHFFIYYTPFLCNVVTIHHGVDLHDDLFK
jgi:hypothetical protein